MNIRHLLPFHLREPRLEDLPEIEGWDAIAAQLRALPVPPRPRDFSLSAEQAATLRPAPHPRLLWGKLNPLNPRLALLPVAALAVLIILPSLFSSFSGLTPSAASTNAASAAPAVMNAPGSVQVGPNVDTGALRGMNPPCAAGTNASLSGASPTSVASEGPAMSASASTGVTTGGINACSGPPSTAPVIPSEH